MQKRYTLLSLFSFIFCAYNAQNIQEYTPNNNPAFSIQKKTSHIHSKNFGDTLYYQDFAGGLPPGWSIVNNQFNNFQWTWNTMYQPGQFSTNAGTINSTTATNGFMSLTADFFNTPISIAVSMDTYFESDSILITPQPSVWVSYQQYLRYCCSATSQIVLQVSTDNFITYKEFDASDGLPVNEANTDSTAGGETNIINISSAVANTSSFKVRFYAEGMSHYFWMIDDFAVIEGPKNDLKLSDSYMRFHDSYFSKNLLYTTDPIYTEIPLNLFPPLSFSAEITNNGSNSLTNVRLETNVGHLNYPNGNTGLGTVYSNTRLTNPSTVVSNAVSDSSLFVKSSTPFFIPPALGNYSVSFTADSDSLDEFLGNEVEQQRFSVSDTVYKRFNDSLLFGSAGPSMQVVGGIPGGTAIGDRYATLFNVVSNTVNGGPTMIPTSISFYVSRNTDNIGAEFIPKIWFIDSTFTITEVASSSLPYLNTDTNRLITVPLNNGPAITNGLINGQYLVGWESTSIAGGTAFQVYDSDNPNDLNNSGSLPVIFYLAHSPGWGTSNVTANLPAIQLNMGNLTISTGISQANQVTEQLVKVIPNPNNGVFKLTTQADELSNYNLEVRSITGQIILTKEIFLGQEVAEQIDLSSFNKGIYFLSIGNGTNKVVEKIVVR